MSMHVNYISMLNSHGCTCMVYMHDLCVYRTIFLCLCMPVLYCVPRKFAVNACSNVCNETFSWSHISFTITFYLRFDINFIMVRQLNIPFTFLQLSHYEHLLCNWVNSCFNNLPWHRTLLNLDLEQVVSNTVRIKRCRHFWRNDFLVGSMRGSNFSWDLFSFSHEFSTLHVLRSSHVCFLAFRLSLSLKRPAF